MDAARIVLREAEMSRMLSRLAFEIHEREVGNNVILLGIPTRGAHLAVRLAQRLTRVDDAYSEASAGVLDVTRFRDDRPKDAPAGEDLTDLPRSIDGATVILVDDVLNSGRTVRAAFDALNSHGRPAAVRLAVLVDRGHRDFPIRPDHVGKNLPTARDERVSVLLSETDGRDAVTIERK